MGRRPEPSKVTRQGFSSRVIDIRAIKLTDWVKWHMNHKPYDISEIRKGRKIKHENERVSEISSENN